MTLFVRATYKDSEYGKMRWYGKKGDHDLFQSPTGRIYEVLDQGSMDSTQKVAFAAWKRDRFM